MVLGVFLLETWVLGMTEFPTDSKRHQSSPDAGLNV